MGAAHRLRLWIAPACYAAALLPFVVASARWGWGVRDALAFFLTTAGAAGLVLAILGATIASVSVFAGRTNSTHGLACLVVAAYVGGLAGLAVAKYL